MAGNVENHRRHVYARVVRQSDPPVQYFAAVGFAIDHTELPINAKGIGDLQRDSVQSFMDILNLLNDSRLFVQSRFVQAEIPATAMYVDTGQGKFIWFLIHTRQGYETWTSRLAAYLQDILPLRSTFSSAKARSKGGKAVGGRPSKNRFYHLKTVRELPSVINGSLHRFHSTDLSQEEDPHIDTSISYTLDHVTAVCDVGMAGVAPKPKPKKKKATNRRRGRNASQAEEGSQPLEDEAEEEEEEETEEAAPQDPNIIPRTAKYFTDDMFRDILAREPKAIVNPLLALDIRRIFRTQFLQQFGDAVTLQWLDATDPELSVFNDGVFEPSRIPDAQRVFSYSPEFVAREFTFPDVLPSIERLKEVSPVISQLAATMTEAELYDAILLENDSPDITIPRITNPIRSMGVVFVDEEPPGSFDMPYFTDAATRIKQLRASVADYDTLRQSTVKIMAQCLKTMSNSPHQTPKGPVAIAEEVKRGLNTFGMHYVQAKDRYCIEGGDIAEIMVELEKAGSSSYHTAIVLRGIMLYFTSIIASTGALHMCIVGDPGDGKTFTISSLLCNILCGIVENSDFSRHAFTDDDAAPTYKYGGCYCDEFSGRILDEVGISVMKILLGRKSKAGRRRNIGFAENEVSSVVEYPTPTFFIFSTNEPMAGFLRQYESKNINGLSAFADRVAMYVLPSRSLIRAGGSDPAFLARQQKNANSANENLARLRYMESIVSLCCLLTYHEILPLPDSPKFDATIDDISLAFAAETAKEIGTATRSRIAIQNLARAKCIHRHVFEYIVMGGDHIENPSYEDLMDRIYTMFETMTVEKEDIAFAASIVMDSLVTSDITSLDAKFIVEYAPEDVFNFEEGNVSISPETISTIVRMYPSPKKAETLTKELSYMTTQFFPGPNNTRVQGISNRAGTFVATKAFLRRGIFPGSSLFDEIVMAALYDMDTCTANVALGEESPYEEKFLLPVIEEDANERSSISDDIVVCARDFFIALSRVKKARHAETITLVFTLEALRKRMFFDMIRIPPKDFNGKDTINWLMEMNASAIDATRIDHFDRARRISISKDYFNEFSSLTRPKSVISRVIQASLKESGIFPLGIPSPSDFRVPDYVQIHRSGNEEAITYVSRFVVGQEIDYYRIPESEVYYNYLIARLGEFFRVPVPEQDTDAFLENYLAERGAKAAEIFNCSVCKTHYPDFTLPKVSAAEAKSCAQLRKKIFRHLKRNFPKKTSGGTMIQQSAAQQQQQQPQPQEAPSSPEFWTGGQEGEDNNEKEEEEEGGGGGGGGGRVKKQRAFIDTEENDVQFFAMDVDANTDGEFEDGSPLAPVL